MRIAIAILLGIVAAGVLLTLVVAIVQLVLALVRRTPVREPLSAVIVLGVIFLAASCGVLIALPAPEQAEEPREQEQRGPEPAEQVPEVATPAPAAEEETREAPKPPPEPEPEPPQESVIPGLFPVDVYGNLEDQGFNCEGPNPIGEGEVWWTCEGSDLSGEYVVEIWGPDASSVRLVEATALTLDGSPVDAGLLGFVATVPYEGSNPEEARLWVEENMDTQRASTKIGGVSYSLTGPPTARILEIKPPGSPG